MEYNFKLGRMTIIKDKKQQMLERMWRKENPCALLVEMQIGETMVGNSINFLKKLKNRIIT